MKRIQANGDRLQIDKLTIEHDLHDLLHEQGEFEVKLKEEHEKMRTLEEVLQSTRVSSGQLIRSLLDACIKSSEKLVTRATLENDVAAAAGTSSYFMMQAEELTGILNEMAVVNKDFQFENNSHVEALACNSILIGHAMASVYVQGITICKTSANIESGERKFRLIRSYSNSNWDSFIRIAYISGISEEIKKWNGNAMELFKCLIESPHTVQSKIDEVKKRLQEISSMIHKLSKESETNGDVGVNIETELAGMDKAIEEAAAKIEV